MKTQRGAYVLILLLPLLVASPSGLRASAQGPPSLQATLRMAAVGGGASIRRDERGIPYLEAANDDDLYFAQGYATASDRLWQMDLLRRTGRGELSEILGRNALREDKLYRTYGFAIIAEAILAKASPSFRAALESYARGVNAFISSCDEKSLPPEFQLLKYNPREWRPADTLVIGKTLSVALSTSWQTDVMRAMLLDLPQYKRDALLPEISPLDVVIVGGDKARGKIAAHAPRRREWPKGSVGADTLAALSSGEDTLRRSLERVGLHAEGLAASNNWAVSGKRTASGKPLLANDPHLSASVPSIWYMTHLRAPGIHVAGVTIPGIPGIIIGHNEQVAWGVTNLAADVQDLYIETFDEAMPLRYKTPGGWAEAGGRREVIKARKSPLDPTTEDVTHEVIVTRHGPIVLEKGGKRYALRWTALDPKASQLEAFYQLNRARNWGQFLAALKLYKEPAQNFVYADVNGHIGYYAAGEIPIRKTGDGSLPYDGSSDSGEWVGVVHFDKLPHLLDPPSGIIVSANNRVVGSDYPYVITHEWAQPYRARRIYDLLRAKQKLTADDFRAIQGDTYSFAGAIFAREVLKTSLDSARAGDDPKWAETLHRFKTWDGHVKAISRGTLMLAEMRSTFRRRILAAALGQERARQYSWSNSDTLLDRILVERPREWLPGEFKSYAELFYACYLDARDALTKRMGPDESKWEWEYAPTTQVRLQHPLLGVPLIGQRFQIDAFPQNGSNNTLNTVNVGPAVSMRFIADASDWDKTQMGILLGQSGDPSRPHWKDQLDDWRAVTPRVFPFGKDAVNRSARQVAAFGPAGGAKGDGGMGRLAGDASLIRWPLR